MNCASIIPIVRLPRGLQTFDYAIPEHVSETCQKGTFVAIPFRGRRVPGLVVARSNRDTKKLKPIERVLPLAFLSWDEQKQYLEWFARQYCISQATALKTLFPAFPATFLSRGETRKSVRKKTSTLKPCWTIPDVAIPRFVKKPLLLMPSSIQERYGLLIALLKKSANNKKNTLIFFPTIHECELFEPYARQAIGEGVVVLHSGIAPTTLFTRWTALFDQTPRCILATRSGAGIPLHNIGLIVIDSSERIEHNQYDLNPRFDARDCAQIATALCGARLVSISSAPRLEDYTLLGSRSVFTPAASNPLRRRVPGHLSPTVINMRDEIRAHGRGYISETLIEHIGATIEKREGIFLFLNRTGTSRMITCRDCGHVLSCSSCGKPASARASLLACSHCEKQEPLPGQCPSCHSVRFHFIALGTEKIAELLKQQFPRVPVREITKTNSSPESLANLSLSSTIIIGTSYLPYAYPEHFRDCGLIGVLAADPPVSLSDFRAEERHVQLLFYLASLARSVNASLTLQTFSPEHKGIQALVTGDYSAYATGARAERTVHGWPPTNRLLRLRIPSPLSSRRRPGSSPREINNIEQEYATHGLTIRSKSNHELLLSLNQQSLPGSELPQSLQRYLMSLPTDWLIDIDPVVL